MSKKFKVFSSAKLESICVLEIALCECNLHQSMTSQYNFDDVIIFFVVLHNYDDVTRLLPVVTIGVQVFDLQVFHIWVDK